MKTRICKASAAAQTLLSAIVLVTATAVAGTALTAAVSSATTQKLETRLARN